MTSRHHTWRQLPLLAVSMAAALGCSNSESVGGGAALGAGSPTEALNSNPGTGAGATMNPLPLVMNTTTRRDGASGEAGFERPPGADEVSADGGSGAVAASDDPGHPAGGGGGSSQSVAGGAGGAFGVGAGGSFSMPAVGGSGGLGGTASADRVDAQAAAGSESSVDEQEVLAERPIWFGTLLNPRAVVNAARERAAALADPSSPQWQATGDQHRSYHFDDTGRDEPYRLYVPTDWDGTSELPLVMFLHGAGSNQNTYVDQNDGQMLDLAQQHGFVLVSPMGVDGAYGNFLRLSAPFGNEAEAAELMVQVTEQSERTNQLSEKDVINVLELVVAEYPIDRDAMFLMGHSMGSGGTWYVGGKYAEYWSGLGPMSGPFVQENGYPWEDVRDISIIVTEGTQTPSLDGSLRLANWLGDNGFDSEYIEVDADHGRMVTLVLPAVFEFFAAVN